MVKSMWSSVMDPEQNPLSHLPKMVRFQIMTYLAVMWCMIFSVATGLYSTLGPSLIIHVLFLIGVFFTIKTFRDNPPITHRDKFKDVDGCVKYDDMWGA